MLIKYDVNAIEKRNTHKAKIDFSQVLEVRDGKRTIENIIAEAYTFQNLDQLNKAFKDWLNIDVRAILYKRKKIGNSISFLENRVSETIQYRHGIVHHLAIDRDLTKETYIHILDAIAISIDEFISFFEGKYQVSIDRL